MQYACLKQFFQTGIYAFVSQITLRSQFHRAVVGNAVEIGGRRTVFIQPFEPTGTQPVHAAGRSDFVDADAVAREKEGCVGHFQFNVFLGNQIHDAADARGFLKAVKGGDTGKLPPKGSIFKRSSLATRGVSSVLTVSRKLCSCSTLLCFRLCSSARGTPLGLPAI